MKGALFLLLGGCATLAEPGGGDVALPNAAAGPFRPIAQAELGNSRAAPFGLKDDDDFPRHMAVLDEDGDPATLGVLGYVARTVFAEDVEPDPSAPPTEIALVRARDGRSFERELTPVLTTLPENANGAPAVVRHGSRTLLFLRGRYGDSDGIGVASSDDGIAFTAPYQVLPSPDATSPAVVVLPDASLRMFYAKNGDGAGAIVEASSGGDDLSFTDIGTVLTGRGPSGDPVHPNFDASGVGAPAVVLGTTPEGRPVTWLYYAARDEAGNGTICLAARYGDDGPFERATAPVYTASSLAPTEPAVVRFDGFTLLYVTQLAGSSEALAYPAIAVGVAPATSALGPPDPP